MRKIVCFLPGINRAYGVLRLKEANRNLEVSTEEECHPGVIIAERSPSDRAPPDWLATGNLKIVPPPEDRMNLDLILLPEQIGPVNDLLNLDIGESLVISELKSTARQQAEAAIKNKVPSPPKDKSRRPTFKERIKTLELQRDRVLPDDAAANSNELEQPELPEEREKKKKYFTEKGKDGMPIALDEEEEPRARARKPTAHERRMEMYGQGGESRKPPGSYWASAEKEKKAKKRRDEIIAKKKTPRKERVIYKEDIDEEDLGDGNLDVAE